MLKILNLLFVVTALSVCIVVVAKTSSHKGLVVGEQGNNFTHNLCDGVISFLTQPTKTNEHYKITPQQSLNITKFMADKTIENRVVASSVTCQQLKGTNYSGNAKEWTQFINNVIKGLQNTGFAELKFTLVGLDDSLYQTGANAKEYMFTGDRGGNKQVIYNLAVLNEDKNTMYTLSVGGNEHVSEAVYTEFKRLVASFKP
jgi:hypothetical protein